MAIRNERHRLNVRALAGFGGGSGRSRSRLKQIKISFYELTIPPSARRARIRALGLRESERKN